MRAFRVGGRIGERALTTKHAFAPRTVSVGPKAVKPSIPQRCQSSTSGPVKPSPWTPHSLNGSSASQKDASDISSLSKTSQPKKRHLAYIALGSNVGDRVDWIEKACNMMPARGIHILRTSCLWETEPMYVKDQDRFLNGVAEVETLLDPIALLDALQSIEQESGRVKIVDKGPRNIDLDILLYDDEVVDHPRLQIPHKLMLEREFVLRPLAELIPGKSLDPKNPWKVTQDYLNELPSSEAVMTTFTPLSEHMEPLRALDPRRSTRVMAILNATPDSFSDGGKVPTRIKTTISSERNEKYPFRISKEEQEFQNTRFDGPHPMGGLFDFLFSIEQAVNQEAAEKHAEKWGKALMTKAVSSIRYPHDMIFDIGGQSTAPGVREVSVEEETTRVLNTIEEITDAYADLTISVDTYRASVAEAAVKAGACIINDVSAGTLDPDMLPTMAKLGVTVILMHMRGTPLTMTSSKHTSYPNGLIPTIASELLSRVAAAEKAGIRRWRIILDPGIGFAKTDAQNLEILRGMEELREWPGLRGLPWLVGSSRKGFIGRVTGVEEPRERGWGTAATVAAAVSGGADVVRVHDVKEMEMVVRMSDAIWRV